MTGVIRGILVFIAYLGFTTPIFLVFLVFALLKFVIPVPGIRKLLSRILDTLASTCWVRCANLTHRLLTPTRFHVHGMADVRVNRWCLLLANHQSWVDILVIIRVFYGKLPPYKFFIKKELLWLPMIGFCLWAMDYPVMKRYPKKVLEKNPNLKGMDIEATRRACEAFMQHPVTVMNFVEGTRFTPAKQRAQGSPYRNLLIPRAGGTALVLYATGELMEQILDVTIVYPGKTPGLWDFFRGRCDDVIVDIRRVPMTPELMGDYFQDPDFRMRFQAWINGLWAEKDACIEHYCTGAIPPVPYR